MNGVINMQEQRIENVLQMGKEILKRNDIDIREARLLLAHALKVSVNELIKTTYCTDEQVDEYLTLIEKRVNNIPFAYIVGHKEFMKLDFIVNENVLIPRADTEILVEEALKYRKSKILDMCTGSGCIAISMAYYSNENAEVSAADISEKALKVAQMNAMLNEVNVSFINSDLFENVKEKYEMILSNPPYIKKEAIGNLQIEVQKEPVIALDGGESGLEFYERIVPKAKEHLEIGGVLILEIGYDQAEDVKKLMQEYEYKNIRIIKDLDQNDRVVIGEI